MRCFRCVEFRKLQFILRKTVFSMRLVPQTPIYSKECGVFDALSSANPKSPQGMRCFRCVSFANPNSFQGMQCFRCAEFRKPEFIPRNAVISIPLVPQTPTHSRECGVFGALSSGNSDSFQGMRCFWCIEYRKLRLIPRNEVFLVH